MGTKKNHCMLVSVLAAMVFFALMASASTSHAIVISGTVTDTAGPTPLVGIYVGLTYDNGTPSAFTTMTIADGSYSIDTGGDSGPFIVGATDNPVNSACGTNYVSEYWNSAEIEPHNWQNATPVSTTQTVNFSLQDGINITGKVTRAAGGANVPDAIVNLIMGSACDGMYLGSVPTDSNGDYCFTVPQNSGALFYVSADTHQMPPETDLASEWYRSSPSGTFYCSEAEGIGSSADQFGIDFALKDGGTISGTIKTYSGAAVSGLTVEVNNDALNFGGQQVFTNPDGTFTVPNLAPGPWLVMAQPDAVDTDLVQFNRDYWLDLSQDRNIGAVSLQQGALISGNFLNFPGDGDGLEYWYGGKFDIGWYWTDNAAFNFRLPLGTYNLNVDPMDRGYALPFKEITVSDVNTTYNQGNLTLYDVYPDPDFTGAEITGTVTDNSLAHNGMFQVMAFSNLQEYTPDKFGGLGPQGGAMPMGGTYSLIVPPSQTVDVHLVLYSKNEKALESITLVDSATDVSAPAAGNITSGHDLAYTSEGYTVDGYVKSASLPEPPYRAAVLLYKQPGDQFSGFTSADELGYYKFYNVPSGDYKIAVTHPRYPDETVWSGQFTVSAEPTNVSDIFMGVSEKKEKFEGDFNGDGKTDILWRNKVTGQLAVWLMNGTTRISVGYPGTVADLNWTIVEVADFSGEGNDDILWRNTMTGQLAIWLMSGGNRTSVGYPGTVSDPTWELKYVADFSGEGKADILWRNTVTGQIVIWLMDGTTRISVGYPGTVSDPNWEMGTVTDFNADSKADIGWRNSSTGQIAVWLMNGTVRSAVGDLGTVADPSWQIQSEGDFNGDYKTDLLWRNSATGQTAIWLINGTIRTAVGYPGTVADANWEIAAAADFSGDGKSDILWHNISTGERGVWLMNGIARSAVGDPGTVADPNWNMVVVSDYSGDLKADILWRNTMSGQVSIWLMNGTTRSAVGYPGTVSDFNWEIQ